MRAGKNRFGGDFTTFVWTINCIDLNYFARFFFIFQVSQPTDFLKFYSHEIEITEAVLSGEGKEFKSLPVEYNERWQTATLKLPEKLTTGKICWIFIDEDENFEILKEILRFLWNSLGLWTTKCTDFIAANTLIEKEKKVTWPRPSLNRLMLGWRFLVGTNRSTKQRLTYL